MIKILDDTKDLSVISLDDNGLGKLEIISGTDTEELNGIYEAEFTCLMTEKYFDLLHVEGLVALPTEKGEQIFRIYYISKPLNKVVTVKCRHDTYDLTKVIVEPFEATGSAAAVAGIMANVMTATPFTITTDIANSTSVFQLTQPRAFRQILGGYQGSFLDVFRGEYEWDNLEVKMLARRGADRGVRIAYRKNLTGCKMELDSSAVYTSVMAFVNIDNNVVYGNVYHKITATYPKVLILDASNDYSIDNIPTTADLTTYAQNYATNNDIESPKLTASIEFVPLWQTDEYKEVAPLERVSLGDTVHADVSEMGMTATARVIKTVWNLNTQRYDSLILGSVKSSLASIIQSTVQTARDEAEKATSVVSGQMNEIASLIINGLGLHRTLVPTADGGYKVYLHNHATLADSDVQYYMSANGIMVSTDYGQTWNAGFDAEGNAVLNSLATITLKALEIYGSRIVFGDPDNKYIIADEYQLDGEDVGISFDGSGYARFRPQETFEVYNMNSDASDYYNKFAMEKVGGSLSGTTTGPHINFVNKESDLTRANNLWMVADNAGFNTLGLYNYQKGTLHNSSVMHTSTTYNRILLSNKDLETPTFDTNKLDLFNDANWSRTTLSNLKNGVTSNSLELYFNKNNNANWSIIGTHYIDENKVSHNGAQLQASSGYTVSSAGSTPFNEATLLAQIPDDSNTVDTYVKVHRDPTYSSATIRAAAVYYDYLNGSSVTSSDVTKLLKWHGYSVLSAGRDLNTITDPGYYTCESNTIAAAMVNCPTTLAFVMRVYDATGKALTSGYAYRIQEITDYQGNTYRRWGQMNNTTTWAWYVWRGLGGPLSTTNVALSATGITFANSNGMYAYKHGSVITLIYNSTLTLSSGYNNRNIQVGNVPDGLRPKTWVVDNGPAVSNATKVGDYMWQVAADGSIFYWSSYVGAQEAKCTITYVI